MEPERRAGHTRTQIASGPLAHRGQHVPDERSLALLWHPRLEVISGHHAAESGRLRGPATRAPPPRPRAPRPRPWGSSSGGRAGVRGGPPPPPPPPGGRPAPARPPAWGAARRG